MRYRVYMLVAGIETLQREFSVLRQALEYYATIDNVVKVDEGCKVLQEHGKNRYQTYHNPDKDGWQEVISQAILTADSSCASWTQAS